MKKLVVLQTIFYTSIVLIFLFLTRTIRSSINPKYIVSYNIGIILFAAATLVLTIMYKNKKGKIDYFYPFIFLFLGFLTYIVIKVLQ